MTAFAGSCNNWEPAKAGEASDQYIKGETC